MAVNHYHRHSDLIKGSASFTDNLPRRNKKSEIRMRIIIIFRAKIIYFIAICHTCNISQCNIIRTQLSTAKTPCPL